MDEPDQAGADERATGHFADFDFEGFWSDCDYSTNYVEGAPDAAMIKEIEAELGYRLPDAYVEFARMHNGGIVNRSCYPMDEPTSWADDHVAITGIYAIGRTATYSLCGKLGSKFMREEWGYPDIGIGIADTPSAGHEQIMLDYRACGPGGEPAVVHVDQECDYRITPVAPDFATFIRGLVDEEEFDESAERFEADLAAVQRGTLSPVLRRALDSASLPDGEVLVRGLAEKIVWEKGFFSLHADANSHLMYDTMFWLYSHLTTAKSYADFIHRDQGQIDYERPCYLLMLTTSFVADPFGFCTGGYSESFLQDWWAARIESGAIVAVDGGFRFATDYAEKVLATLREFGAA